MSSGRGSHSRESSPAGSRRTTRHNGSLADNFCADELPGTRSGHARHQGIDAARASSGQLSGAESRAALSVNIAVVWKNAVQLVSDAQPVLKELLGLDRGARALDPDAAAALPLTHAQIPGANMISGTYCGTWAGTYYWACPRTLAHSWIMRIRAQTQAQGRARACVMASRTAPNVWSLIQKTEVDSRDLRSRDSRTKSKDGGCVLDIFDGNVTSTCPALD